jgi:hydroxypyruvate reductase
MDDMAPNGSKRDGPRILIATAFAGALRDQLEASFKVTGPVELPIVAHLDPNIAAEIRALVTVGVMRTDAELMDFLPNLALISCLGSGYEGVDIAAALQRGIVVTHSPAANAAAVADLALGLLLAANRNIVVADKFVRDGQWRRNALAGIPVGRGLEGCRIGIYGYGAIGAKIAARCAAFEAEIAYFSRARKPDVPYDFHPTLQSLADWADIFMVAVRADASNRHAVDADVMRALGPEGILVNISRGSVVDETALIALLQSGQLGSAGLDVFEHEPVVPEALKALPQVVLTPHVGGGTRQARAAMEKLVLANITAFFAGLAVPTPIPEMKSSRNT